MSQSTQPREPKGRPTGGRWTEQQLAASGLALTDLDTPGRDLFAARREELAAGGFVPGLATQAVVSPETTERRADWWDTHFVQAEYAGQSGGYPQMPDDYTPGQTLGHALSGNRRTHRMKYTTGGVQLRMPSKTSIARYSAENGHGTFDVPVSASLPSGDVQGWVRVTRNGPGQWHTTGVGFEEGVELGVAEAVGATLEGRAAALKPQSFGDLIARRTERQAAQGIAMEAVSSTWIESVGYDHADGILATMTTAGSVYGHQVPPETFEALRQARSPGALFNKAVKGHDRVELSRCSDCGRYKALSGEHKCPGSHKDATGPSAHTQAARARAAAVTGAIKTPTPSVPPETAGAATGGDRFGGVGHTFDPNAKHIDLRAKLQERASDPRREPGTKALHGERGWTVRVADELEPFTASTYVPSAYHEGINSYLPAVENGSSGPMRFDGVDAQAAAALASKMPPGARSERQNNAPTVGTMLAAAAQNPGTVELSGYVVGPDRSDERVSVDGVYIFDAELTQVDDAATVLNAAKNVYGLHDAARRPDELRLVEVPWRPGEKAWHLWWD